MLNFPNVTTKFCTIKMFVTVNIKIRSSGNNLRCLFSFKCFYLHGEISNNYKLITVYFSDPFLYIKFFPYSF